ncbi:MAG TPA: DUF2846 domain-containing protein [Stellaceae bacterium]|nr:DUF2846 domain-containing protein [Stellaceae bacterium]
MQREMVGRIFGRGLVVGVVALVLAVCGPAAPLYPEVAATIPPVATDRARIYFYREYEPYESLSTPNLYLNGTRVGVSGPGMVFYRDVVPGTYTISTWTQGDFQNGSKTVVLRPGDTIYSKVESLGEWQSGGGDTNYERDTFIVMLIDPARAQGELARMHYVQGDRTA